MNTSNPLDGERIGGTVGPALPGVSVRVVDDTGAACGPEAVGAIEVKGPNVSAGYWRMPEKTREEFTTGGLNVYPKEIEEKIDALPGVVESAVIGVADADFGEAVTAVVVPGAGHALTEAAIIAALKTEIANFKVPKRVHFVDDLPRNSMGKVQKNVLRDRFDPAKQ